MIEEFNMEIRKMLTDGVINTHTGKHGGMLDMFILDTVNMRFYRYF